MPIPSFCGRRPFAALLAFAFLICGSVALAGTNIQLSIGSPVQVSPNNPHHIPAHLDPKSSSLAEEIRLIKEEIKGEVAELNETVHSVALRDFHGHSQPVMDYTTGTSN